MTSAISRDSFDELKNYLGVHLQQGRVILDADWNEAQDIAASLLRRVAQEALGDGSPNTGFKIDPVFPPPPELMLSKLDTTGMDFDEALSATIGACVADLLVIGLYLLFGPILFFLQFPGRELEGFESLDGFSLSSTQGALRIGRDRPAQGDGFLRLSGHPGTVTITRTLPALTDLSAFELATFRYRLNRQTPGTIGFFLEDDSGNRSVWRHGNIGLASDLWLSGFAAPLDLRFQILTDDLVSAVNGVDYGSDVYSFGGATPIAWSVAGGTFPSGLTLTASGTGEASVKARLEGTPTATGTFRFTVKAVDAAGAEAKRELELQVRATGEVALALPGGLEFLSTVVTIEKPTGTAADLKRIVRYGFELYQDTAEPLVWDLDDLRVGSSALERELGENNFIIRGSQLSAFLQQITLLSIVMGVEDTDGEDEDFDLQDLLALINTQFDLSEPTVATAGRFYLAGLPCLQVEDILYTDQADPHDPPLTPPPPGTKRTDTVYLDAWTETVTYIEDPAIRDVALGGPDTATRSRVRHRVRVAQGDAAPTGHGIGDGTLATEGAYTAQANRLYRVEVDGAGDIGGATIRWSQDNASTLARVIESVPPGSRVVVVEDAAAFHPGDLVLLRKELGAEEHVVDQVLGNAIGLRDPTGSQLAALPAAARVPGFTTFAVADRPALQRWNAFGVRVKPDPADATISAPIELNDGIAVRFGGHGLRRGDYWTFTTRYLAGDEATGLDPVTRVERLDFARARGPVHHFAPLATITRDGDSDEPDKIFDVVDRRPRVGSGGAVTQALTNVTGITGTARAYLGGMALPPAGLNSRFIVFWSGDLYISNAIPPDPEAGNLTLRVSFFGADAPDPATDTTGTIQDREIKLPLQRRGIARDLRLSLAFANSDVSFEWLPISFAPASVHAYAELDLEGFSIELTNMQLMALELKRAY